MLLSVSSGNVQALYSLDNYPADMNWYLEENALLVSQYNGLMLVNFQGQLKSIIGSEGLNSPYFNLGPESQLVYSHYTAFQNIEEYDNPQFNIEKEAKHIAESSLNEGAAAYAHDGGRVAMLSDRRHGNLELWIVENATSHLIETRDITIKYGPIRWSPDDKSVMLLAGNDQLVAIERETRKIHWLSEDSESVFAGSWGLNSDTVFYSKKVKGQYQLFERSLSDRFETQITEQGGYFSQVSRNGRWIYYSKRGDSGLWKIDNKTAEHQLVSSTFGARNYSRWQLFDSGIYYRHDIEQGEGIMFFDLITNTSEVVFKDVNIWLFHISDDQQKILLTKSYQQADLMVAKIVTLGR